MKELKFRAVINERTTIYFTLEKLVEDIIGGEPRFSIRELLIPWLRAGNKPDMYTERKDKNGKKIYEGDQLSNDGIKERFLPFTVKFGKHTDIAEAGCTSHSNLGFFVEDAEGEQIGLLNEELSFKWEEFVVIGNIR